MVQYEHPHRTVFTPLEDAAWWERTVVFGHFRVWTLLYGDDIAGFVNAFAFTHEPQRTCETGIVVFEPFQRQGVATAAYQALLPLLRSELRIEQTWCGIHPDNQPSLRLFNSLGYRRDGTVSDPPIEWVKMTLTL